MVNLNKAKKAPAFKYAERKRRVLRKKDRIDHKARLIRSLTEINDTTFFKDSRIFSYNFLFVSCFENFSESKVVSFIFFPSLNGLLTHAEMAEFIKGKLEKRGF
ncbi:MAG: hypothetical protein R2828_23565 [Saprospiraceae bacterium]